VYAILVNLVPTFIKCGSPVTDLLEAEIEEQRKLKRGKYVNSVGCVMNVRMSKKVRIRTINVKIR
jgi:hypothetical protein